MSAFTTAFFATWGVIAAAASLKLVGMLLRWTFNIKKEDTQ